jgi:hypothetical protein
MGPTGQRHGGESRCARGDSRLGRGRARGEGKTGRATDVKGVDRAVRIGPVCGFPFFLLLL